MPWDGKRRDRLDLTQVEGGSECIGALGSRPPHPSCARRGKSSGFLFDGNSGSEPGCPPNITYFGSSVLLWLKILPRQFCPAKTPPAITMPAAGKEATVSADEEAASPPTDVSDECRNDAELAAALRQSDQETQVAVALSKQERKELPMCVNGCGRVAAEKSRYGTCCRTCRKKSLVHGTECNKNFFGDVDPPPEYVLKKNHWMPKEGEDVKLCLNGCGRRVPQYNRSNRYCCTTCGPFHRRHGDWCNVNHFGEGQSIPKECDMLLLDKVVRMCNQGCGRPAQQVAGYKRCCRSCSFKGRCLEHSEECLGPAENVILTSNGALQKRPHQKRPQLHSRRDLQISPHQGQQQPRHLQGIQ